MVLATFIVGVFLSIFSTAVMSYVAMATPIGPWIAPTLALMAKVLFRAIGRNSVRAVTLVTIAGSIGGILATGFAFSFPAIYFLDTDIFSTWMACPRHFISMMTLFAACAGGFGMFLANLFEHKIGKQDQLPFPIALLISKMINVGNQARKGYELLTGFALAGITSVLQDGFWGIKGVLFKAYQVVSPMVIAGVSFPGITFDVWPMLWAIGFIAGHVIALPLVVGAFSRWCIVEPLNVWWFRAMPSVEFTFAFCSGMVLLGVVDTVFRVPRLVWQFYAWMRGICLHGAKRNVGSLLGMRFINGVEQVLLLSGVVALLMGVGFSCYQILYLLVFAAIFSYQMVVLAAKWGMAPLGRFATFVMLPAMLLFKLDKVLIVFVALFVEVCGGVAYDLLCGRMVAKKSNVDRASIKRYQYLGLSVSVAVIGMLFWALINACQLGSSELFAYKAQSRALLINALLHGDGFNGYVLLIGALFGFLLSKVKINPLLVLGGLLMPLNLSLGLIFGGMLTYVVKDREQWEPFWSGVFAADSVWMLVRALF